MFFSLKTTFWIRTYPKIESLSNKSPSSCKVWCNWTSGTFFCFFSNSSVSINWSSVFELNDWFMYELFVELMLLRFRSAKLLLFKWPPLGNNWRQAVIFFSVLLHTCFIRSNFFSAFCKSVLNVSLLLSLNWWKNQI